MPYACGVWSFSTGFLHPTVGSLTHAVGTQLGSSRSQLYSSATDTKHVDESVRLSEYRAIVDEELFDVAARVVATATAADPLFAFSLRRNDVTHIRYLQASVRQISALRAGCGAGAGTSTALEQQ